MVRESSRLNAPDLCEWILRAGQRRARIEMSHTMFNLSSQSRLRAHRPTRRLTHALHVALAVGLFVAAPAVPQAQQGPDPRSSFLDALGAFGLALDGMYGDEGARLTSALDRMEQSLSQWDATIAGYERALAAEIAGADASGAGQLHFALGLAYLDRGRIADALAAFGHARRLGPSRGEPPLLEGLVSAQWLHDAEGAAEALRAAATLEPNEPEALYALATHLSEIGDDDAARDALRQLAARLDAQVTGAAGPRLRFVRLGLVPETPGLEPFLPPVRYADGFAALRGGDLRLAVERFRTALATDPLLTAAGSDAAGLRARAAAAFRDGRVSDARAALQSIVGEAPSQAEAYRLLGAVELADGRYESAITALRRAVMLDPDDERARVALADALVQGADQEAALRVLTDTLEAMPDSARTSYALGLLHRQEGRYADARVALERTVSRGPLLGLNSVYQTIGAVRRAQLDLEGALEAYTARVALTPNDARAHQDAGDVHFLLGNNEWALVEFTIAARLEPSRVEAYTALGQLHLRESRYQEATEASLRALNLDAGDREARYVYATALIRLGRTDQGTRELQTFQRLQAEDATLRARALELGRLRREAAVSSAQGDYATASALLREALTLDPRAPASHYDLGLALLGAGRLPEAIERLSTAAALGAPIDVHVRLAEAYAANGQAEDGERARARYEALKRDAIRREAAAR